MIRQYKILSFTNYDGDSFRLNLDMGFNLNFQTPTRIIGIDTPELKGGTDESKAAGRLARDRAREFVREAVNKGQAWFLSLEKPDKFGRALGDILYADLTTRTRLTDMLLSENLAVRYEGQNKAEIQSAHDRNLEILQKEGKIQ